MVIPGSAFLLPFALWGGLAWLGAPPAREPFAMAGRLLALLALALPVELAWACAAGALWLTRRDAGRWDLAWPIALVVLLRARLRYMPVFPESMGFWAGLLALLGVMGASQQLLAAEDADAAGLSLARGQAAWMLFAFLAPAPLAWSGGLLLLWQQPLLRQPLARVLVEAPGRAILAGLLFLGLAGGPLLSAFNAYFQVLAPFMTEAAVVPDMQAKLFSSKGLLAVVAILALLYQTGSFGYFYWSRVLPAVPQEGTMSASWRPVPQPWAWVCLALSSLWGLAEHWSLPGSVALAALRALDAFPRP
jgi:hypothetical protein